MINSNNTLFAAKLKYQSPPRQPRQQTFVSADPLDVVSFSAAKSRPSPGLSALQKMGLALGLTAAVGGAFVAGTYFNPEAVSETQVDARTTLERGAEDLKTDWNRGIEDFKTGWKRGVEDARDGTPNSQRQLERELEDLGRQIKRDGQDAGKEIQRAGKDFWRELTN